MKKRLFGSVLAALMLLTLLAPAAYAEETEEATEETSETIAQIEAEQVSYETSGTCGDNITWELNGNTLRVTGSGKMKDGSPWAYYKDKIKKVTFTGGITYVGANAFQDCENLIAIDFGEDLHTIGAQAFMGCTELASILLPASFRKFEADAFRDCTALESVYCQGPMPSFRGYCLYNGNTVTIYTPVNNPWPQEEMDRLKSNYGTQLDIISGSVDTAYKEPYVAEPTQAPTEAPAEPETVPTLPPVQVTMPPETVPVTEPATIAATEPAVVEEVPAIAWLEETTEPQARDVVEEVSNNGWIGMVIIAGVFTFLIAGALIFRSASRKGGRYTE